MTTLNTSPKLAALALFALIASGASAQTTWTGGSDGLDWSDPGNWSNGVPGTSNGAIFNSSTGISGFFEDFSILSLTFNGAVATNDEIAGGGGAGLQINAGGIVNNTSAVPTISSAITAGANSTWDGPLRFSNNVNLGIRQVTLISDFTFAGTNLNFDINSTTVYGRFLGAGTTNVTGVTINFFGTYTGGVAGDTFDFTTGSFTGATLNVASLPTLTGGLTWNTTQFISQGLLTVVSSAIPEPSTWAAMFGVSALGFAACKRRRQAK